MSAFDSKICLVTGAGSGIGPAVAFAKAGARVAVCDVNEESAHRTAAAAALAEAGRRRDRAGGRRLVGGLTRCRERSTS
ncbi:SDR family NAD(P)-dependent oxidoreductase [Nonomuraea sp. NPDC049625]|uniref:SDR family NAD(P)-dependent oxidoreductase n=1 Tax=Nonomuraea sp. NPDC049625 TaxID=3155775 RepID=UPI00342E1D17